jgi:conjugal transfer mating pair stabilization protein TraG
MEFTIFSIGSATYLEEILNAVAMISGSGDIESLAKIGLGVGALILAFQAVFNNTGIQFQKLLVCTVLYLAMYGPSGRALIQDVYTGNVAVVDNVPLGPLAIGSITSNLGYNATRIFEQAFSTPSMTSYGFADPLNTLVQVRLAANNVFNLKSMGTDGNANLLASWSNYMRECTLTGANNDERAVSKILENKNALEGLRFDSTVYYTKIYDGSPDGITLSCTDAYTALTAKTNSKEDDLLNDIAKSFAKPGSTFGSTELEARLNDSLIALAGGVVDARQFTVTAALLPILEGAPGQRAISDLQGAAAIMMSQAAQQQATQWAAEGSMFTKYIRPFMTFFEGFIYAITPLMAFVIVLGGFGIGLVSKYLMMLVWMMLWMPVLAIVNLYTISETKAKLDALLGVTSFGMDGISFENMRSMLPVIEAQIGVAGMMAAAVPALCMFLVYGTSVAASGIASKLGGSDTINEKISSPDVVSPGAGLAMSSQVTHDPTRGGRQTGFDEMVGSMVSGSQLSSSVQSMSAKAEADQQSFTSQLSSASQQTYGSGISTTDAAKIGEGIRGTNTFQNSSTMQDAYKSLLAKTGSQEQSDAILGATAVGASLKGSVGTAVKGPKGKGPQQKAGVDAGIALDAKKTTSDSNMTKDGFQSGTSDDSTASLSKVVTGAFANDKSFSLDKAFAENSSLSKMVTNSDSLTKAAQKSVSSNEAFQEAESALQSYGINTNTNGLAVAQQLAKNGGMEKLQHVLDYTPDGNTGQNLSSRMQEDQKTFGHGLAPQAAYVAAGLKALADTGNIDKLFESGIDANRNSDIHAPNVGDIGGQLKEQHSANNGQFAAAQGNYDLDRAVAKANGGKDAAGPFVTGSEIADTKNETNRQNVSNKAGEESRKELSEIGRGAKDIQPFRTLGGIANAWESLALKDKEEQDSDFHRDASVGRGEGLSESQSVFYAAARRGDVGPDEIEAFERQQVTEGFSSEESAGIRIKLEEASTSDAPKAHMGQIQIANDGVKPTHITSGNDGGGTPGSPSQSQVKTVSEEAALLKTSD